jgi:transposase
LLAWAAPWPARRWAVEGATGLGHTVAQQLVGTGELVVDVPAKLAARARLLGAGSARKTDRTDAASVAAVALHHRRSATRSPSRTTRWRCGCSATAATTWSPGRTRTLSRLQVLLCDLQPGGAERNLTAQRAAALLGRLRPVARVDRERKRIARELLADVRRLDQRITAATKAIGEAVTASGTTLTEVFGLGPVLAAKILGHAGDLTRFPDRDHFASSTGTAPIEASSGEVRRHRLHRGGNRQLNTALQIIAVCQIRDPAQDRSTTSASYARPRRPRRHAARSSASSPTWSTGT